MKEQMKMLGRTRLHLAAAMLLVALSSTAAYAETLIVSPAREITLASLGKTTFESNVFGAHVECNITLSGTLTNRGFASTRGTAIGSITRATVTNCTGGTMTPLVETRTPWNVVYEAVDGTFPDEVTGYRIKLEGVRVLAEVRGLASCLYTGDLGADLATSYITLRENEENLRSTAGLTRLLPEQERFSRSVRLSGTCPTEPTVLGTFRLAPEQTVEQEETFSQIGISTPTITYTGVETRSVTAINNSPKRAFTIESAFTTGAQPERFEVRTIAGGRCAFATVISPNGGSCIIDIRFNGPAPATATLNVNVTQAVIVNPVVTGSLVG